VTDKPRLGDALQSIWIQSLAETRRRATASSPGISLSFRDLNSRRVSQALVREPTSPLAISSAMWDSGDDCRVSFDQKNSLHPLFDFGFPPESSTTSPSLPNRVAIAANSSHGLSFPSAHTGNEGPLAAGLADPATFRLQGLVTLLAVYSPRSLSGLVSSRQRSWDSPFEATLTKGGGCLSATAGPACR
jgi:hypothetical protein